MGDAATYSEIAYTVDDPVAVITMQRPERLNALTIRMLAEIRDAVEQAERDRRVVGIVITGAGRGFCAGLDAEVLESTARHAAAGSTPAPTATPAAAATDDIPGLFTYFLTVGKPIIAAVNGPCAGGGFVLAVMSDIRIASNDAMFTTVFSKRGLIAEHGTSWILPRLLGAGRALDLLWTSRRVDAGEALRIGLVEQVVEPDELLASARAYITGLADVASPSSLRDTKRLVYAHLGIGYPDALREADRVQWDAVARPDATEGVRSFVEKRPPLFERLGEDA